MSDTDIQHIGYGDTTKGVKRTEEAKKVALLFKVGGKILGVPFYVGKKEYPRSKIGFEITQMREIFVKSTRRNDDGLLIVRWGDANSRRLSSHEVAQYNDVLRDVIRDYYIQIYPGMRATFH
jgi:hypothetical protein